MPETTWVENKNAVMTPKKIDRALEWIKHNRETFIGSVVILAAAVVFGVYFFIHYRDLRDTAWKNLFIAQQTGFGGNIAQAQDMLANIEKTYGNTSAAPFAMISKGDMYYAQGQFKEAEAEYAKVLALKSDKLTPFAMYNVGKCKEAQGDLAGAQAQYSDMLAKYPEHFLTPETHYSLARAQELAGGKDLAKATYEKIVLLYPETSWAAQAKAKLEGPAPKQTAAPVKK